MPVENDVYSVSISHYDLSFDSNEFLKKSFSVDEYLQEHRNKTSLETLRDDLGIYLRILRSSMIELINKDYADFVNLSSNLIGLDKAINGMQFPLGQLKEEIVLVKTALEESLNNVTDSLKCRHDVFMKKWCLQNLSNVEFFLSKFSNVLDSEEEQAHKYFLDPDFTERVALEYNRLLFSVSQCETYLTDTHTMKARKISDSMMRGLDNMFLKCLKMEDINSVARCLRTYAALDRVHDAEMLYRKNVVAPAICSVISETAMESSVIGLSGIYNKLLDFLKVDMSNLLEIIRLARRFPAIKCFSFVLNSFWPEVEERLEMHLSSIFAPGNPDLFYKHFAETEAFMKNLEYFCEIEDSVRKFRKHRQYRSFIGKWNLSIYFQIRFQEIGGPVELMLSDKNLAWSVAADSIFKLAASETVWNSINKCWADGIFLRQLTQKFWKLNLLILARYNFWISTVLQRWPISVENTAVVSIPVANEMHEKGTLQNLPYLVCLYNDIKNLVRMLPSIHNIIMSKAAQTSQAAQKIFEKSLHSSEEQLMQQLPKVTQVIVNAVSHQSIVHLKQVNDIPRLYRRTNREIPTKACPYVAQMLIPPTQFYSASAVSVPRELLDHWLQLIFSAVTKQFLMAVNDVLTSVQKTEESLRRLKKIRDRSGSTNLVEARGIGDDDKIRQQLALDVRTFTEEVENKGVKRSEVEKLEELICLVEDAAMKTEK